MCVCSVWRDVASVRSVSCMYEIEVMVMKEDIGTRILNALEKAPKDKRRLVLGYRDIYDFDDYIRLPDSVPWNIEFDFTQEHRCEFI